MCQKLWKLAGSRQSYCKNYLAYFFWPTLYVRGWPMKLSLSLVRPFRLYFALLFSAAVFATLNKDIDESLPGRADDAGNVLRVQHRLQQLPYYTVTRRYQCTSRDQAPACS